MDGNIQYNIGHIRSIAEEAGLVMRSIEDTAGTILKIAREINDEYPSPEMDTAVEALKVYLNAMINGYKEEIGHLDLAGELYEQCSQKVYDEAEQIIKIGRMSN